MVLIGIGLDIWVNIIWRNNPFQLIVTAISIAVFVCLVMYDTARIKEMSITENNTSSTASLGAFALYLDLYYLLISIVFEANKGSKKINS
jgi:FtsH-binding integral membrane protein